jgi:hypothetical protein
MASSSQSHTHHDLVVDRRLTDAVIDSYVDWREECAEVQSAYERWRDAPRRQRVTAFANYHAALDREERASEVYAELVDRLAQAPPKSR